MSAIAPPTEELRVPRLRQRRVDPVPNSALWRWVLRLAFALPAVAVTVAAELGTASTLTTPNQALLDRVAAIDWTRGDAGWVGDIFPPLSTLLAVVVPGGRLGMSILGAIVAGFFVQQLLQILVQRGVPKSTTIILLLAVAANPLFVYVATENLPVILGLSFFGVGISDALRFVVDRRYVDAAHEIEDSHTVEIYPPDLERAGLSSTLHDLAARVGLRQHVAGQDHLAGLPRTHPLLRGADRPAPLLLAERPGLNGGGAAYRQEHETESLMSVERAGLATTTP